MVELSICIPTFNHSKLLDNCLNSICISYSNSKNTPNFEVIVSDNCSIDETEQVVSRYSELLPIVYSKNGSNLGRVKNYLNAVAKASGKYVWLLGDDDLLMPSALSIVPDLLNSRSDCDFFYINSYCLESDALVCDVQPYDTF